MAIPILIIRRLYIETPPGDAYLHPWSGSSFSSGNDSSPVFHQAITWTNSASLSIGASVTGVKWLQFCCNLKVLTQWGWVTHVCVGNLTIIGSDNGLSPGRRQAIISTNAGISLIGPLGTNFSEILAEIMTISFKKMYLKVSSVKWWPFCLSLNVLSGSLYVRVVIVSQESCDVIIMFFSFVTGETHYMMRCQQGKRNDWLLIPRWCIYNYIFCDIYWFCRVTIYGHFKHNFWHRFYVDNEICPHC